MMYKIVVVTTQNQGLANVYAYENWDQQGGWNTFSTPLFDTEGALAAFCCGILLPDDASFTEYMHTYATLDEATADLGLTASGFTPDDDILPPEGEE